MPFIKTGKIKPVKQKNQTKVTGKIKPGKWEESRQGNWKRIGGKQKKVRGKLKLIQGKQKRIVL